MRLRTVATYSDADTGLPFVREADDAIRIGPASARESYLAIDRVIAAARETRAELVHPGYGFLAEDPDFARAVDAAGLVFVGPSRRSASATAPRSAGTRRSSRRRRRHRSTTRRAQSSRGRPTRSRAPPATAMRARSNSSSTSAAISSSSR